MGATWAKRTALVVVVGLGVATTAWFAWPRPIPVDLATVSRGPLEVTIDDEARTRVRHVYTVSAPVAGKVLRISTPVGDDSLHVGDQVIANETIVAVMQPMAPSFLDARSREELQAAVDAADAATKLAAAEVRRIEAALDFSRTELDRAGRLAETDTISIEALDKAKFDVTANEAALASAEAQLDVRHSEHAMASARLIDPARVDEPVGVACCIQIRAPATGRVLKIIQESEAVVPTGAPLLTIGDPLDLEVVADLLSTDAVRIDTGAPVRIEGWGGPPIGGRVSRIDPSGFVKVSALGIEEQRVRTIIDFVDPPDTRSRLGDGFRVIVRVTIWNAEGVVTVPVAALFRQGEDWAVFAAENRRARTKIVSLGHRSERVAEVVSGLSVGDRVVLHPSDRIRDGVTVAERSTD